MKNNPMEGIVAELKPDYRLAELQLDQFSKALNNKDKNDKQFQIAAKKLNQDSMEDGIRNYRNKVSDEQDALDKFVGMFDLSNITDTQKSKMTKDFSSNFVTSEGQSQSLKYQNLVSASAGNTNLAGKYIQDNIVDPSLSTDVRLKNIDNFYLSPDYNTKSNSYKLNLEPKVAKVETDILFSISKTASFQALDALPISQEAKNSYKQQIEMQTDNDGLNSIVSDMMTTFRNQDETDKNAQANLESIFLENMLSGNFADTYKKGQVIYDNAKTVDGKNTGAGIMTNLSFLLETFSSMESNTPLGKALKSQSRNTPYDVITPREGNEYIQMNGENAIPLGTMKGEGGKAVNNYASNIPYNSVGQIIPHPGVGVTKADAAKIKQWFKAHPNEYKDFIERINTIHNDINPPKEINY